MNRKRRLRWMFIALPVIVVVATVGWISNAYNKAFCQQQVGLWLLTQRLGGRFFYLLDPDKDRDVHATFDSIGGTYAVLASNSDDPKTWPRLSMKTHTSIPFFISVDYFWEREAEFGGGATKWFFSLFGRVVEIGETNQFAT